MNYPCYFFTYEKTGQDISPITIYKKRKESSVSTYIVKYYNIESFIAYYHASIAEAYDNGDIDHESLNNIFDLIKENWPEYLI